MQACAQLEQKLRQCMDAPVRALAPAYSQGLSVLTISPARSQPEEEQHQLPPLEDVSQDCGPSQAQLDCHSLILFVHYPYPHGRRRMKQHHGGVLSLLNNHLALWRQRLYIDRARKSRTSLSVHVIDEIPNQAKSPLANFMFNHVSWYFFSMS